MAQPKWRVVYQTDYSTLFEDTTGVYPPELEVAEEYEGKRGKTRFLVFRVVLDRLKEVGGRGAYFRGQATKDSYVIPYAYDRSWSHPIESYKEWFSDSLGAVARSAGGDRQDLVDALCSDDPRERAAAYQDIAGHHGWENFDSEPLDLSEAEFEKRMDEKP